MTADQTTVHLRRALQGDLPALGQVVARLSPLLITQAHQRLGPVLRRHVDPEDLVQDVWLVALPRLADLQARAGRTTPVLLRFLSTSLLHRVRNLARKHLRENDQELSSAPELDAEQTGVVSRAIRAEQGSALRQMLEALPELERELLVARGIEGVPLETVAMLTGLEPKTASKRYHRLLERIRKEMPGAAWDELSED